MDIVYRKGSACRLYKWVFHTGKGRHAGSATYVRDCGMDGSGACGGEQKGNHMCSHDGWKGAASEGSAPPAAPHQPRERWKEGRVGRGCHTSRATPAAPHQPRHTSRMKDGKRAGSEGGATPAAQHSAWLSMGRLSLSMGRSGLVWQLEHALIEVVAEPQPAGQLSGGAREHGNEGQVTLTPPRQRRLNTGWRMRAAANAADAS
eukprot:356661-Chlamydomonas_euryale.AAC.4